MKLDLIIDGKQRRIELESEDARWHFQIDGGPPREADVETPEPGVYSIVMDGRSYDARIEEAEGSVVVVIDGHRFDVQARDPREWVRGAAGAGAHGVTAVKAPMPGKVVRVLVAAGETVAAGQGLLVVEAMKMQNEMKAARAGRVGAVLVREGATVSAGETLATVE